MLGGTAAVKVAPSDTLDAGMEKAHVVLLLPLHCVPLHPLNVAVPVGLPVGLAASAMAAPAAYDPACGVTVPGPMIKTESEYCACVGDVAAKVATAVVLAAIANEHTGLVLPAHEPVQLVNTKFAAGTAVSEIAVPDAKEVPAGD